MTIMDATLILFNVASEASGTTYSSWGEVSLAMVKAAEEQAAREEIAKQNATLVAMRNQVMTLVNDQRTTAGVNKLTTNAKITAAANKRAKEIVTSFSHTRPDGTSCFTVWDDYNIAYTVVGENIAAGYPTAASVMNGWMNSSGHKANILDTDFDYVGVGVYEEDGYYYWVQLFYAD